MNIQEKLLTVNQFSRPGIKRNSTTKIAVHYVGNPGTSAIANRNYFENCKSTGVYVSSNYIVGLDGEVIRCVPDDEMAYCTNQANSYSISIETCHPDRSGKFNSKTYASLVELCAMLLKKYKLTENDLIRHFDVTGKVCPKCFVAASNGGTDDNALTAWKKFKADVKAKLNGSTTAANTADKQQLYRVRKSWPDAKSQIGAFSSLDNAKKACKPGYSVFDGKGKTVYTKNLAKGSKISLKDDVLYGSSTSQNGFRKSGMFYVYDGEVVNGRIRITSKPEFCGKTPVGQFVTGWLNISSIK